MKKVITCTLLVFICCQISFAAKTFGVKDEKLTVDEEKAAREIAAAFEKRINETGDLNQVINELFVKDFIRHYIKEQKRLLAKGRIASDSIFFSPGFGYKINLLDEASPDDLKDYYVLSFNFANYGLIRGIDQMAKYILKGEDTPDYSVEDLYPPAVVHIAERNPILNDDFPAAETNGEM